MLTFLRDASCSDVKALLVATGVAILSGTVAMFGVFTNDLKGQFSLSQTAVELISSLGVLGNGLGYPFGLLYECCGSGWGFLSALLLAGSGCFLIYSTQFYVEFHTRNWFFIAFYWAAYGCATILMYLITCDVCMSLWPGRYKGFILGYLGAVRGLGPSILSAVYTTLYSTNVPGFFLPVGVAMVTVNLFAAMFVRKKKIVPVIESSEDACLVENTPPDTWKEKCSKRLGLPVLRSAFFYSMAMVFSLGLSTQVMFIQNISTYLDAFDLLVILPFVNIFSPLLGVLFKILSGLVSDLTLPYYPRSVYLVICALVQCIAFSFATYFASNSTYFIFLAIVIFATNGTYWTLGMVIISDNFGKEHFTRDFGIQAMLASMASLIILEIYGAIYERNTFSNESTCQGQKCFFYSFVLAAILSCFSFAAAIMVCWMEVQGTSKFDLKKLFAQKC